MSADLKSLFPANPALRSVLRPEDLAAETLARHLPWLSAPADNLILTRQGDLIASAVVEGQDSFTTEEGDLSLATTSLARLIGQLGEGFGFHVSKLKYTDEISSDTAESMGEDLSAAMGSAVEAYTSLPPIITVAPGAAITVMVDRDLEIW